MCEEGIDVVRKTSGPSCWEAENENEMLSMGENSSDMMVIALRGGLEGVVLRSAMHSSAGGARYPG